MERRKERKKECEESKDEGVNKEEIVPCKKTLNL
jgi:hypothetical protein